jgi:hypothetical protein
LIGNGIFVCFHYDYCLFCSVYDTFYHCEAILTFIKKQLSFYRTLKNIAGINGGYYSGGLQQAHSTTPLEAPHSAGSHGAPPSSGGPQPTAAPPVSAVNASAPPQHATSGIQHAMVSKSVC